MNRSGGLRGWRRIIGTAFVAYLVVGSTTTPAAELSARNSDRFPPPAARADTTVQLFETAGITVIHRRTRANGLLAVNLYLLGGVQLVTEETAGIEPLLLETSERGTRSYPGLAALKAEVRTGSRIVTSAQPDWTLFGFRGMSEDFEDTWAVFADRVMYPELDSAGVAIARERMLTSRRADADDPEALAAGLAARAAFRGHPYARAVNGTESSLESITVKALRDYHAMNMVTTRMLLVVVGDLSRERIEVVVGETLGELPRGEYAWEAPPTWIAQNGSITARSRGIPTNYIVGYFGGPEASSDEYPAFQIALALTSGFFFQVVRGEGLSYAAGAYPIERAATGGVVHISTNYPAESIEVINEVLQLFKRAVLPKSMLRDYAKGWITGYWLENETNGQQASFLARGYLYGGQPRTPEDFVEELRNVPPDAVRRVANRYMKNIQYAFVGDTALVPRSEMGKH